ncbi:MAG: hypothetical protein HUU20_12160 [Pirellulales bacterium]|nr:hypothetical protein [Pirellulales bacterium]
MCNKLQGNDFLLMKRSARRPNRVSQAIVGLTAGRCYSLKMFTADHRDLVQAKSENRLLTVSVDIDNVEVMSAKSFVSAVKGQKPVAQYFGKELRDHTIAPQHALDDFLGQGTLLGMAVFPRNHVVN